MERSRGVPPREPPLSVGPVGSGSGGSGSGGGATATATVVGPISDRGVGEFVLGGVFPEGRLDRAGLTKGYVTTLYSDVQPLEGFRVDEPRMTVMVRGAYHRWGEDRPFDKAPPRVEDETIRQVLAKKLTVDMIVVTEPGVRTDRGIGVGDTLAAFRRAYPEVQVGGFPPLWEEPTCVGMLGHLAFFFTCTMDDARALPASSPVRRIVAFVPLEEREAKEKAAKIKPR